MLRVVFMYPGQLTQKMGATDCMLCIRVVPVRRPAIVYSDPLEFRKDATLIHSLNTSFFVEMQQGIQGI